MEIKQGDKVRVSKDAPRMYVSGHCRFFYGVESVVKEVEDGNAIIMRDDGSVNKALAIPCKYLVKVGGEYKPKFKKSDKVRFKKVYTVVSVDDGQVFIDSAGNHIDEDHFELYTEPKEQTEAENQAFALGERVVTPYGYGVIGNDFKGNATVVLERGECCGIDKATKILTEKVDTDWDAYAADLAKEVAVKVANKYNDPEQAAEYVVRVVKAVVENLKKR